METWALILAAGSGARLAEATGGVKKQFLEYDGEPLFLRSARTFFRVARLTGLVFVFPPEDFVAAQERCIDLAGDAPLPWLAVPGGARRQDSVWEGLAALPPDVTHVLVHDAARPFASPRLVNTLLDALEGGREAVIPALPVTDTVKIVDGVNVSRTLDRSRLVAVQTPQAFVLAALRQAHLAARAAEESGGGDWDVTDDAGMLERLGRTVVTVPGEAGNVKITTPADLERLAPAHPAPPIPRTAWGYDVHRYGEGRADSRPFVLGAVPFPGAPSVLAHSDGDVLLHAVADALLGLIPDAGGDIGARFPDTDPALEGIQSAVMVNEVLEDVLDAGLTLTHVDVTVIAQVPKIAPRRQEVRAALSRLLRLDQGQVNVKATTEEGLGFTGAKEGIKAVAVITALAPPA